MKINMKNINLIIISAVSYCLVSLAPIVYAAPPPIPAKIYGTVTIDGTQITQNTDDGLSITVTKQDGTAFTPVAEDTDGLNDANIYSVNIPLYEPSSQPGGANPGDIGKLRIFRYGTEYIISSPANGQITVGESGSTAELNITASTPPSCMGVNPLGGSPGASFEVTIYGSNTHFNADTTQVLFSCCSVTVNQIKVTSLTELTASITIDAGAAFCSSDVTVITGDETITCWGGFLIGSLCNGINPYAGTPGQTLDVSIYGRNTYFNETSQVTFSCSGITVNSIAANSPENLVANITIAPDAPMCRSDITVKTGDETITCEKAFLVGAECVYISPSYVQAGETQDITIYGNNSNFSAASLVSFSCSGVTVNSVSAYSPTQLIANITIAADAPDCQSNVTVTTGNETITCEQAFYIHSLPPAQCNWVSPSYVFLYGQQTLDVMINGYNTHFDTATSQVAFSCSGITVNSVTAYSPTQLIANITIAADAPDCRGDVTVITGTETITCTGAFEVDSTHCAGIGPFYGDPGETLYLTINGNNTHFDNTTQVSFSCSGITVNSVTANSATQLTANITIAADAPNCFGDVTATTGDEGISCVFIVGGMIYTNPSYAEPGNSLDITIYGTNTDFDNTSQVSFSCSSITVNSMIANSSTELVANITIAPEAPGGYCDVSVITEGKTVAGTQSFYIQRNYNCSSVAPSAAEPGETLDVTINSYNTHFDTATSQVLFSCSGITVNKITAASTTQLIVNITIAADAPNCTGNVMVTTGSEVVTCESGFEINNFASGGKKVWDANLMSLPYIGSAPGVSEDKVYVSTLGNVSAFDSTDGTKLLEILTAPSVFPYYISSPVVYNRLLYTIGYNFAAQGVFCFKPQTGCNLWQYLSNYLTISSPAVSGGYVYIGGGDGSVYCLNAQTGAVKWEYGTGSPVYSTPAVSGGYVYIGSYTGTLYCLNAQTGAFVWKYETNGGTNGLTFSSPAVSGGYVYIGGGDGTVYCLNAQNGELEWEYNENNSMATVSSGGNGGGGGGGGSIYPIYSSPAVAGGYVYVGGGDGRVYCLNAQSGALEWKYATDSTIYSSPAISGGYVYIGSANGTLYCLNGQTGAVVWKRGFGAGQMPFWSSPVVSGGYVYIEGGDGKLYCLSAATGDNGSWPFFRYNPERTGYVSPSTVKPTTTTTASPSGPGGGGGGTPVTTTSTATSSVITTTTTSIPQPPPPNAECLSVTPSAVDAGATVDVTVAVQNIDLSQVSGVNLTVGCAGITVNSVNVNSATQIIVNITAAEDAPQCTGNVTVTDGTGATNIICENKFTVNAKPACTLAVSPGTFTNGIMLPRIKTFTITGTNSNWGSTSAVQIQGINMLIPLSRSENEIRVLALVPSKMRLPAGNKVVTVTTGNEVCTGNLVIE